MGYSPWSHKESDMTEYTSRCLQICMRVYVGMHVCDMCAHVQAYCVHMYMYSYACVYVGMHMCDICTHVQAYCMHMCMCAC